MVPLIGMIGEFGLSLFDVIWCAFFFLVGIYLLLNRCLVIKFLDSMWTSERLFFKCFRYVGIAGFLYAIFESWKEAT